MHNHAEITLSSGVSNGTLYQISFRAKWLGGSNQVNTRVWFNRLAKTTLIDVPPPSTTCTPGAQNSQYESNMGPTLSKLAHSPAVPAPSESVTVSVITEDPDGTATPMLYRSIDG